MQPVSGSAAMPAQAPYEIQDNVGFKIASAIPGIGFIFNSVMDYQLKKKYDGLQPGAQDAPRAVNILKITNQYNAIRIARNVLMIAAVVALFVLGFFTVIPLISALVLFAGVIALKSFSIYKNKKTAQDIQLTGFRGPAPEHHPVRI